MSARSWRLRSAAAGLRRFAGQLEEEPFGPVRNDLSTVWIGPAAEELASASLAYDAALQSVADDLRSIAAGLDRQADALEAAQVTEALPPPLAAAPDGFG